MQENYPKLSAAVAGDRKFDVYMGIDVFGRGTFGGGQWNVRVIRDMSECLSFEKKKKSNMKGKQVSFHVGFKLVYRLKS